MRISDWSSDVCSSDLSQEVANRKILLATGIEEDNSVYFSLRDSGSGIPAENLAQIFHGFFTTKENGLGIGLAICHSIVAAQGGSNVAANRPEGRSEENTSEIQSRMSISYAVSCL